MIEELSGKSPSSFEGGPFVIFLSPLLSSRFRKKGKERNEIELPDKIE